MDSVYEAVRAHADELKAELQKLQAFLDLHDHFSERFGLTPAAEPSEPASAEAEAPLDDQPAATHEIHLEAPSSSTDDLEEAESSEGLVAAHEPEADPEPAEHPESVEHTGPVDHEAPLHAHAPGTADEDARVIQASEGVLSPATSEAKADAPLGPEATLQSVAEKLAATINASHPSVTGYTV